MTEDMGINEKVHYLLSGKEQASKSDYFAVIKELAQDQSDFPERLHFIDQLYEKVREEIENNSGSPVTAVKFGTSGWRGILGKDLFCKSVAQVTSAIVEMYKKLESDDSLAKQLGVSSLNDAREKGCVIGFDNRFCGDLLASVAAQVITAEGIKVFYAGETTTGVLSACVLQLDAAFSINFTPSHNPLEYGGLKFNAADGGPAASEITEYITLKANEIIRSNYCPDYNTEQNLQETPASSLIEIIDSFSIWEKHVIENGELHGVMYDDILESFNDISDISVVVDSVHGASRLHIDRILKCSDKNKLKMLRNDANVTFGGVAPEPSSANMVGVVEDLNAGDARLKLGAIVDPDGDRIRFTDGKSEISMNQFGAMAYHFLHQIKGKRGMVAKTVATSNLANTVAESLGEVVFEPKVGFKEFKPVIGDALVCFEESDGISIIGHTPEKDAYIGLLLAVDMVLTTNKNLTDYLKEIEDEFGYFYPDRDGIEVSLKGDQLLKALSRLEKYDVGVEIEIGGEMKKIATVIDIDGRKMILEDGSWLMIRPSGTEPKVRFYVESRTKDGTRLLVDTAKKMLAEIGLI